MRELGIRTYVVWIPMLDADEGTEVPAASTNVDLSPQYFDGQKRLGDELGAAMGIPNTVWDAFLFYPPGVTSTDRGLPAPAFAIAQQGGVIVGTPGTLPAVADQSRLLPELRGKMIVIGEQAHFEDVLREVAAPFAARHRAAP